MDERGLVPNPLEATCVAGGPFNPICDAGVILDVVTYYMAAKAASNVIYKAGKANSPAPYSHVDEREALNTEPGMDCNSIKWAIKVLKAQIAWRQSDLNPSDGQVYKNHLKRIQILEKHLKKLEGACKIFCGGDC